jgi:hypothetical protein
MFESDIARSDPLILTLILMYKKTTKRNYLAILTLNYKNNPSNFAYNK